MNLRRTMLAAAGAISISAIAQTGDFVTEMMDFFAPSHNGTSNLGSSPVGSIIYDQSTGDFKGKADDGSWVSMSTSIEGNVWYVDANIGGGSPSLETSTISSFTGVTHTTLELTENSGSDTVYIACSGTEEASGTTCTGDESVGISFSIPNVGPYRACASFTHYAATDSAADLLDTYFQLVETPTNSQTISQNGKTRLGHRVGSGNTSANPLELSLPIRICGNFNFSTTGTKVLRLMYAQNASGSPIASSILAAEDFADRDIHWEVYRVH